MGDTEEVVREMQILQDALDAAIANENREEQAFYDRKVIEGMKRLLLFFLDELKKQGAGSREQLAGSNEQGVVSNEQGAVSNEQGVVSKGAVSSEQ
jgi:hypothetical protein